MQLIVRGHLPVLVLERKCVTEAFNAISHLLVVDWLVCAHIAILSDKNNKELYEVVAGRGSVSAFMYR